LKVQVTDIGVVPVAILLRHPGIRFEAIAKETLPATETVAVIVMEAPLAMESATDSATVIGALELLVIVLEETLLS
jgi:hypothetical protein